MASELYFIEASIFQIASTQNRVHVCDSLGFQMNWLTLHVVQKSSALNALLLIPWTLQNKRRGQILRLC